MAFIKRKIEKKTFRQERHDLLLGSSQHWEVNGMIGIWRDMELLLKAATKIATFK